MGYAGVLTLSLDGDAVCIELVTSTKKGQPTGWNLCLVRREPKSPMCFQKRLGRAEPLIRVEYTICFGGAAGLIAMKTVAIRLCFQYRRRHGRLALQYGRPLEQRTVERRIVRGHAGGRKSLLEPSPNSVTIKRKHRRQQANERPGCNNVLVISRCLVFLD
jgi:hypothetical protein